IIASFSSRFDALIAEASGRTMNIIAKTATALTRTKAIGSPPFCNCGLLNSTDRQWLCRYPRLRKLTSPIYIFAMDLFLNLDLCERGLARGIYDSLREA